MGSDSERELVKGPVWERVRVREKERGSVWEKEKERGQAREMGSV